MSLTGRDSRHRDTVWLFIDFVEVKNNAPTGIWQPATLTPAATTVTAATGNAYMELGRTAVSGNTRGVWIHGKSTTNSHATDYPPNLQFTALRTYQLHGTPPFRLTYNSAKDMTINDNNVYTNTPYKFFETLIDRTECPGIINCKESTAAASLCIGSAPALRIVSDQDEY